MTVRPDFGSEYGDEERKRFEEEAPPEPQVAEEESELHDLEREDEEVNYLDPEANEAHAPGSVCLNKHTLGRPGASARKHWPSGAASAPSNEPPKCCDVANLASYFDANPSCANHMTVIWRDYAPASGDLCSYRTLDQFTTRTNPIAIDRNARLCSC